jgi:hypothetical protein
VDDSAVNFDFDHAVTAPFRMQPGLRRLATGAHQLTPAAPGSRHQREKLAVLGAFAGQALLAAPGFDAAPALDALLAQAAQEHPRHMAWDGERARSLGVTVDASGTLRQDAPGAFGHGDEVARCLRALPTAWRLAALASLAFEEDFAVVDGTRGTIPWLAVALPSHWAPEAKVGRHFAEVHAPVTDSARLLAASEALTRLVTGPQRWERFVWTVTPHPRLHAHPARVDGWPPTLDAATIASQAWWRTERQTFVPLPERRLAVFTIHVQMLPLAKALDTPARAAAVHDAIASMSDAVLAYRGLAAVREALLAWLRQRAKA